MTVSTTAARVAYAGNGSTVTFTVPWYFLLAADLRVIKRSSAGTETLLSITTHYTVAGAGISSGGSVMLVTAPATGETITIIRDPVIIQSTDYLPNDPFPAEAHERALDLLTMAAQRLDDRMDRALVLADSDTPGSGAYQAGQNRITNMAPAVYSSDAVTLLQVQALITTAGVGGGGGGSTGTVVVPDSEVDRIIALTIIDPSLVDLFTPLNDQVGNLAWQIIALNGSVSSINTSVGTISADIVDMQADIAALSAISGDPTNIIALITDETNARIDGDSAIVETIGKIGAAAGDNVSFIMSMDTVFISPTETIGTRFDGIATQFGDVEASVLAESVSRSNADSALSQTILKIGALNGGSTAFIIDLNTAYVGPSESLGQRFSGIAAATNANTAAISSEQSARANADSSLAVSITNLQSTVGGHTTTISQHTSTINGIQGKYSVKIDNNGAVSGFDLVSTANVNANPTSKFKFLSTAFEIWNGTTGVAPFSVVGGVVYMGNIVVGSAQIENLQIGKLVAGGESTFAPRAWARLYSTSNGAFITRQNNIASITRQSAGRFTVTFATPLSSKYYVVTGSANIDDNAEQPVVFGAYNCTVNGFKFALNNFGYNGRDADTIHLAVFGSDVTGTVPPTAYDPQNDPAVTTTWSRTTNSSVNVP